MEMDSAKLEMMRETMPHTIVLMGKGEDGERVAYEFFDLTVIEKTTAEKKTFSVIPRYHCYDGERK